MRAAARQLNRARLLGRFTRRDLTNLLRYGKHSPRAAQGIVIDPRQVHYVYYGALWPEEMPPDFSERQRLPGPELGRYYTGCVVGGDWDLQRVELEACPKYEICVERSCHGKSWAEAGAYALMMQIIETRPGADGATPRKTWWDATRPWTSCLSSWRASVG